LKTKPVALALAISAAFGHAHAQSTQTLEPVVVTASKFEEPQGQATAIVDVIDRQQIDQSGAANITELLDQVSGGLLTRQYGRLGADASFDLGYLGGASVQRTLVLVDGVRMNDIDGATIRWGQVPLDAIERIEVRKAGGGVLFGDRALGGVVNLITKRTPGTTSATVTLGSFGTRVVGVQTAKQVSNTSIQIAAQQAKTDGYRQDADQAIKSLQLGLSQITPLGTFGLDLRSAYENVNQPNAISLASFQANPKAAADYAPTRSKRRGLNTDLSWLYPLGDGSELRSRWSKESSTSQAFNVYENNRDTFEVSSLVKLGSSRMVAGLEHFDAESASDRLQRASVIQTSTAGFLNLETPVGLSLLNVGFRQQQVENRFYNTTGATAEHSQESLNGWSLGGLTPIGQMDLRYSLQTSFAFPHADQLFTYNSQNYVPEDIFGGVKPMRSEESQISVSLKTHGSRYQSGVRHLKIKDEIGENEDCTYLVSMTCYNMNLYDTTRTILFLDGSGRIGKGWSWRASVDRIQSRIDSGSNKDNLVPMVPNLVVRASLGYQSTAGRFQLLANHRGKMVKNSDNDNSSSKIPERVLFDAGYSIASKGQELSVWIRNLADHQYFDFAQTWGVAPADGRSIEVRFKQTF
jgi:iron complex outermembrane receptor protein